MATKKLDWNLKPDALKPELNGAVEHLLSCQCYTTTESTDALKTIRDIGANTHLQAALGEHLVEIGYSPLLLTIYKALKETTESSSSDAKSKEQAATNLCLLLTSFGQFTAGSLRLCTELQNENTLPFFIDELRKIPLPLETLDKNNLRECTLILELLYNNIRHCNDLRTLYKKLDLVPLLTAFLKTSEVIIKTTSLVILAYVVDETESDKLATTGTDGCVNFLIFRLKAALHSRIHRAGGFTAAGLLEGLIHLMASDHNKVKVLEQGALPLILRMLKRAEKKAFSEEEQVLAATAIWKFAFIDSNRATLKKDRDVVDALYDFKACKNAALRNACCGALWEIYEGAVKIEDVAQQNEPSTKDDAVRKPGVRAAKEDPKPIATLSAAAPKQPSHTKEETREEGTRKTQEQPHIMISYQWDSQQLMIKVKNALQQAGYNVWMDVDKMEGNILMAMANAVEKAAVVLVAMSHKYKESNNCRTEASYAYKMKKPIVPLLVEDAYDPDGWLGALVGMLLYYKIEDQTTLQKQLPQIMKELGENARIGAAVDIPVANQPEDTSKESDDNKPTVSREPRPTQANTITVSCQAWNKDQVQQWLSDNDLSHLQPAMEAYDGKCVAQMHKLSQRCPEYFHQALKTDLNLDLLSVIKLSIAMDKLFK
ncbi:uncharacterized protein [Amphiura filiformis]|uniref:uncharacterized protein n=1 Tax=Amphiura filiformis TaxID=82378 RepID=UPI003B218B13